ncbi:MAG: hypothetical protein EBV15_02355 [Bacteroidetes bacterium]|nr:hypothetical protein [Bacteroidota bacterium]
MAFLRTALVFIALAFNIRASAQKKDVLAKRCDVEQQRIDLLDGKDDTSAGYASRAQFDRARQIYFNRIDQIQAALEKSSFPQKEYEPFYLQLISSLQGVNAGTVRFLGYYDQYYTTILELARNQGAQKDKELLKNNLFVALEVIPYFVKRASAAEVLLFAAAKRPYDVLTKHADYQREKWVLEVLETVAKNDPNAIKQFIGTLHPVNNILISSKDSVVQMLYDIYRAYGRSSSSYTNIHLVYHGELTVAQSESLARDEDAWFTRLCSLRRNPNILGSYSVDAELNHHSIQVIRKINLLHDEKNEKIRFKLAENLSAEELYNLMVYSRDEIFTSTFLGLFKRMMQRRSDSSMYVFFSKMGFNRFRTFVQTCAGYNTLQTVLNTMSAAEQEQFINEIVKHLDLTGGNLGPAVEVADIFGSLSDSLIREKMIARIHKDLRRCYLADNRYGMKIYGLLYKLAGKNPVLVTGISVKYKVPELTRVEADLMFPDGKNVQQHIFYDDEDGNAAFKSFKAKFSSDKYYKLFETEDYLKIESVEGKKIILYMNKPSAEKGLANLMALFEKEKRYPDIVVHRGHSYHLQTTIEVLTSNTKVAVLGSCGGYQNISRVLENASDAQIVSSKQIGTWTVNNELLKDMCEMMRTGTGEIVWSTLWAGMEERMKNNDKWKDYIPPNRNLGVKFVKAFQVMK